MKYIQVLLSLLVPFAASAEVKPVVERSPVFRFKSIPAPSSSDAATQAKFTVVDGQPDGNGGGLVQLNDGKAPAGEDQPRANFFFSAGTDGGRIAADLGRLVDIKEINTFSIHRDTRAPQVYEVYGRAEVAPEVTSKKGTDPVQAGWKLIAKVDTRAQDEEPGGAHGVSIANAASTIGKYRHLLFDISRTESEDAFGNTFFSEIDVVDATAPAIARSETPAVSEPRIIEAAGGQYRFILDTSSAPDLAEWAEKELGPVVQKWYPTIVGMLPSPGYDAPKRVMITFTDELGGTPAAAAGSKVMCNTEWFRKNLTGEARGAVVHELVHVVQQYGRGRRNRESKPTPGWITEGIPDYIRWFLYEPETRGAEINKRNLADARYDASYRVTGNFLNWVLATYDKEIITKLNAAAREGRYEEELWKKLTGKTVQELGDEWKQGHVTRLAATTGEKQPVN